MGESLSLFFFVKKCNKRLLFTYDSHPNQAAFYPLNAKMSENLVRKTKCVQTGYTSVG